MSSNAPPPFPRPTTSVPPPSGSPWPPAGHGQQPPPPERWPARAHAVPPGPAVRPEAGWVIAGAGLLTLLGGLLPWQVIGGYVAVSGHRTHVSLTLLLGLTVLVLGLLMGLRAARVWAAVVALLASGLVGVIAVHAALSGASDFGSAGSLGLGVLLTLLASLAGAGLSAWAIASRPDA